VLNSYQSKLKVLISLFLLLISEVILVLLLEKIEFSLSNKDIAWQMNPIATPNIDINSTTPTLPMKLSLVNP